MKVLRFIGIIFLAILLVAIIGTIALLLLTIESGEDSTITGFRLAGVFFLLMFTFPVYDGVGRLRTYTFLGHLRRHFHFNNNALRANAEGRLTRSQAMRLRGSTFFSAFLPIIFGFVMVAVVVAVVFSPVGERVRWFILFALFGIGMIAFGIQKIGDYQEDRKVEVQSVVGKLRSTQGSGGGTYASNTGQRRIVIWQLYIEVPNRQREEFPKFRIPQYLHEMIQSQEEDKLYRVYYLPKTETLLSLEEAS